MPATPLSTGSGIVVTLRSRDTLGLDSSQNANRAQPVVQQLINYLDGAQSGASLVDSVVIEPDTALMSGAFCTFALSSGSGTVGVDLNGVALTDTWAGTDNASAALVAAKVNASTNALVQGIVKAGRNSAATITCASVAAGDTVTISGITLTAVAGTRQFRQFSKDTSDTATGADLCLAINEDPVLGNFYAAVNASGTVSVYPKYIAASAPAGLGNEVLSSSNGTRAAVTQQTTGATIVISAMQPGAVGNSISIIATGTGASIGATATPTVNYASGNRLLAGGKGGNAVAGTQYYGRFI